MSFNTWLQSLQRSTLAQHTTLVLNHDERQLEYPLKRLNGKEIIIGLHLGRFTVVKWSDTWVNSVKVRHRLPSVVKLKRLVEPINLRATPSLTLQNLFVRDEGRCQYTGEALRLRSPNPAMQATIDHVVPRALGGLDVWNNVVLTSAALNNWKGCATVAQLGLPVPQPWQPTNADLLRKWLTEENLDKVPPDWRDFLQEKTLPRWLESYATA